MSKIGWYVHYRFDNYLRYGTELRSKSGWSGSIGSVVQKHKQLRQQYYNKVLENLDKNILQELEDLINAMIKPPTNESEDDARIRELFRATIDEYMREQIGAVFDENLNVTTSPGSKLKNTNIFDMIKKAQEFPQELEKAIQSGKFSDAKKIKEWEEVEKERLQNILAELKELEQEIIKGWSARSSTYNGQMYIDDKVTRNIAQFGWKSSRYRQSLSQCYFDINDVLNRLGFLPATTAKGEGFEIFLAGMQDVINAKTNKLAKDEADKIIQEHASINSNVMTGKNQLTVTFRKDDVIEAGRTAVKYNGISVNAEAVADSSSGGQAKVDVRLEYKGAGYRVSAKNINPKAHDLKLESSVQRTLFYHIQDDIDFANHALNLLAAYKSLGGRGRALRSNVVNEIKLSVLYNAATGGGYGVEKNEVANVLIINDNRKGQVKVISFRDLLNKIENQFQYSTYSVMVNDGVDLGSFVLDNSYYVNYGARNSSNIDFARYRIANIIKQANSVKLTTSLSKDFVSSWWS